MVLNLIDKRVEGIEDQVVPDKRTVVGTGLVAAGEEIAGSRSNRSSQQDLVILRLLQSRAADCHRSAGGRGKES